MAINVFMVLLGFLFLILGIYEIKQYRKLTLNSPSKAKIIVGSIGLGILFTVWFSLKIFELV